MDKIKAIKGIVKCIASCSEQFSEQLLNETPNVETIFSDKNVYDNKRLFKMIVNNVNFDDLTSSEKLKLYDTDYYSLVQKVENETYNNYINQIMQEIHNRISLAKGVKPDVLTFCNFKENPNMSNDNYVQTDAITNHMFINANELFINTDSYEKLRLVILSSYSNKIYQTINMMLKDKEIKNIDDEELFLVLTEAINRYNIFSKFDAGNIFELRYLNTFDGYEPIDMSAYIASLNETRAELKKNNLSTKEISQQIKEEAESYKDYLQDSLLVETMKIANLQVVAFINDDMIKSLGINFIKAFLYIYNVLAKDYFKKYGATIQDNQSFFEYIDYLDARAIIRNPKLTREYITNDKFNKIMANKEQYFSVEELNSDELTNNYEDGINDEVFDDDFPTDDELHNYEEDSDDANDSRDEYKDLPDNVTIPQVPVDNYDPIYDHINEYILNEAPNDSFMLRLDGMGLLFRDLMDDENKNVYDIMNRYNEKIKPGYNNEKNN